MCISPRKEQLADDGLFVLSPLHRRRYFVRSVFGAVRCHRVCASSLCLVICCKAHHVAYPSLLQRFHFCCCWNLFGAISTLSFASAFCFWLLSASVQPLATQAAEKAVAQSNREINGYQVASISMTADRIAHYQQVIGGEELQRVLQEPAHPFALSLQGLFPQLAAAQTQQPGLSALGESMVLDHQTVGSAIHCAVTAIVKHGCINHVCCSNFQPETGIVRFIGWCICSMLLLTILLWYRVCMAQAQSSLFLAVLLLQGVPTLGVDDPLGPFLGLGGHMDYHFNDLSLQPSVLQMGQPHLAHQHMQQQQHGLQQGQQLQNGGPPGAPAHPQLSGNSLLQPRFQEALLAANLGGQDMSNPRLLSPGVGAPAFSRLDLLSQQQAMAHQHGHQTVGGQHVQVQPDQQLGRGMASYNSCPLDVDTVLRAQLAAATGVHHPSLAQKLPPGPLAGQVTGSDAANTNQAQQDFNPTVRRPADGFGEAPSAFQEPLREPYLFSRVDLHGTPSHAPSHAVLPNPGSLHPAPF